MLFYFLIIFVISLGVLHYCLFHSEHGRTFNRIPGPHKLPVIGNALEIALGPVPIFYIMRKFANDHQKIYGIQSGSVRFVNIFNPEDTEIVLSSSKHINKSFLYGFIEPWLKQGLLTSSGDKWRHRRKILTPAFHFNILKQFCKTFEEQSDKLVAEILSHEDNVIDVFSVITQFTINTMCETAMGTQANKDGSIFNKYKDAIDNIGLCILRRISRLWIYPDAFFGLTSLSRQQNKLISTLHQFTKSIIRQKRQETNAVGLGQNFNLENDDDGGKKRMVMLDLLLSAETAGKIDENGIREEVDTFMFEGHDTTAIAICFCLMTLANHKNEQIKIMEELDRIFEDPYRAATTEDLSNMKYLEMCIKECLRLYPSVPLISRILAEDVKLTNYVVPAGTTCILHFFDMHRDSALYPSPDDFMPDRFTQENNAKKHPFAYVPFSAGPRNCIGQKFAMLELKSVMSKILRNFILEPVTKPHNLIFQSHIVLRTTHPIYVKFVPRNHNCNINENNHIKK